MRVGFIFRALALPVITCLLLAITLPYVIAAGVIPLFGKSSLCQQGSLLSVPRMAPFSPSCPIRILREVGRKFSSGQAPGFCGCSDVSLCGSESTSVLTDDFSVCLSVGSRDTCLFCLRRIYPFTIAFFTLILGFVLQGRQLRILYERIKNDK